MKKTVSLISSLVLCSAAFAADVTPELPLDKIDFQLSARQWVSTQTALLTVNLDATLNNSDLAKVRSGIMDKLTKIAAGEWHLIKFERSQDGSGLEKLNVLAQARVPQNNLTSVYQNVKSISKPGETYQIAAIEFKPSLNDIQQVQSQLRERLYQQANDELTRINKIYAGQHFTLNNLVFVEGDDVSEPRIALQTRGMVNAVVAGASIPTLTVSNELTMKAMVEVASNRQQGK